MEGYCLKVPLVFSWFFFEASAPFATEHGPDCFEPVKNEHGHAECINKSRKGIRKLISGVRLGLKVDSSIYLDVPDATGF